jgi:hypothetical protein
VFVGALVVAVVCAAVIDVVVAPIDVVVDVFIGKHCA